MPRSPRIPAATPASPKREPKPVGLKVLSDHLGLSVAAISRVLSAAPAARSIPKETQDRILAAAEMLNYRPNLFARSLRNRRSQTIGVLVPEVSEGYTTLVLSGIEHQLLQADYFYFLVSHHHREEMIQRSQRLFQDRAVEGIIAVDTLLRERWAIPTVTVSGHHEPKGVTNIVLNHRLAAALAVDHLRGLGHRRHWRSFRSWSLSLREICHRTSRAILPRRGFWLEANRLHLCLRSMMSPLSAPLRLCERQAYEYRRMSRWWGLTTYSQLRSRILGLPRCGSRCERWVCWQLRQCCNR